MSNIRDAAESLVLEEVDAKAIVLVVTIWPIGVDDAELELDEEFELDEQGKNSSLSGVGVLDLDEGGLWGGGNS